MIKTIIILMLFSILFCHCDRVFYETEIIENIEVWDHDIVGFISYNCCEEENADFEFIYKQEVNINTENNDEEIHVLFNNEEMTEKINMTGRSWVEHHPIMPGDTFQLSINIDNNLGTFSGFIPCNCFFSYNCGITNYFHYKDLRLFPDTLLNADYYLLDIIMKDENHTVKDTTFIFEGTDNELSIPVKYFNKYYDTYLYIYVVNGPKPGMTQISNIDGDLNARIYTYTKVLRIFTQKNTINKDNISLSYNCNESINRFKKMIKNKLGWNNE